MTKESNLSPVRHLAKASSFSPEEAIKAFRSSIRSETTRVPYACAARHFLCWLNLQGIQITAVDSAVVRRFADHDCSCPRYSAAQARDPYYVNRVRRFVRFAEDRGDIPVINDIADLGQHMRRYAEQLASLGYNRWSQRRLNSVAEHLGLWLQASRIGWHDVNASVVERFVHHDCGCAEGRKSGEITKTGLQKRRLGAVRFLAFLQESDTVSLSPLKPRQDPAAEAFGDWLRHHRGATERTVESYVFIAARFLPALGPDPSAYDVAILRQIVLGQPAGFSRAAVRKAATVLRCFLRFQASNGRCRPELQHLVPSVMPYRLSTLPRYADQATIERIIAACGTDTPARIRDRAIILLLARLGLRAGEVVALQLEDIDWHVGELLVRNGQTRVDRLPLPYEVGQALAQYLSEARPRCSSRQVFLRAQAPMEGFSSGTAVAAIVRRALERAGVDAPSKGAHVLRHTLATRLLREGSSLPEIGEVLRHRQQQTTTIYAKVDFPSLRAIAPSWPGGAQ